MKFAVEAPASVPRFKPLIVLLSPHELAQADGIADERQRVNFAAGRRHRDNANQDYQTGTDFHRLGARGELAVEIATGVRWSRRTDAPDDGFDVGIFGVRTTQSKVPYPALRLQSDDCDSTVFIHVVKMTEAEYHIAGWIRARQGKRQEFFRVMRAGRSPAFWVPQSVLHDPARLILPEHDY